MGQLDVHDDQIGAFGADEFQHLASVAGGHGFIAMRLQKVAEQFQIELIVFDNKHPFRHERLRMASKPRERSEEHTSELQSLMRISYAVFCLKKKKIHKQHTSKQH